MLDKTNLIFVFPNVLPAQSGHTSQRTPSNTRELEIKSIYTIVLVWQHWDEYFTSLHPMPAFLLYNWGKGKVKSVTINESINCITALLPLLKACIIFWRKQFNLWYQLSAFPLFARAHFPSFPQSSATSKSSQSNHLLHLRWNSVKLSTLKRVLEVCCFYI